MKVKVEKFILTDMGEVIYCKDNTINTTEGKNGETLYYVFRRFHDGSGVSLNYFHEIIAQDDSLYFIIEYALKYYRENPKKHKQFLITLDGLHYDLNNREVRTFKKGYPIIDALEILMRRRLLEHIEFQCKGSEFPTL